MQTEKMLLVAHWLCDSVVVGSAALLSHSHESACVRLACFNHWQWIARWEERLSGSQHITHTQRGPELGASCNKRFRLQQEMIFFISRFCSFLPVIAVKVMRWSAIRRCCQLPFVSREWKVLAVKWPGSNLILSHVYTAEWLSSECVWVARWVGTFLIYSCLA